MVRNNIHAYTYIYTYTYQANATAAKKELKEAQDAARHPFPKVLTP